MADDPAVLRERVNQLQHELDTYRAKARALPVCWRRAGRPRGAGLTAQRLRGLRLTLSRRWT